MDVHTMWCGVVNKVNWCMDQEIQDVLMKLLFFV